MAFTSTHSTGITFPNPFRAIWNGLIILAEANPRMKEIEKLNNTTDEELAERGLERADVVRHIFRDRLYI